MRFLDLDVAKPDTQTIRAAVELLEAEYPVLFPIDTCFAMLMRFSETNVARLTEILGHALTPLPVAISEDADWQAWAGGVPAATADFMQKLWPGADAVIFDRGHAGKILLHMPAHTPNRAFHTLVQLCDFPLIAANAGITTQDEARNRFAALEYGFWDDGYIPAAAAPQWDATHSPPVRIVTVS